ncbi:MAG: type III-A CRISPR-associated RAMP protein Csm5 [Thermodesulfovibrio sp.]|nr:type III-A CRISPR-associated RAMP protein Csm5 [Thermodesulfovibrio sp.]
METYEKAEFKITVKSPIHIGGFEQKITRFEFLSYGQYIYPVSENRLSLFLQKHNLISAYCAEVERLGHRFNLADFFRNKRISLNSEELENLSFGKKIKVIGEIGTIQFYRSFIRDGFGNPYIPGTSIKGVFRSAILYNLLKQFKEKKLQDFIEKIERRIEKDISDKKKKKGFFDWGNIEYFQKFVLADKNNSSNTDWLRMLHITDAYSENEIQTILIPVNILKKQRNGWQYKTENTNQRTTIWVECLPVGATLKFEAKWDKRLLAEFKRENPDTAMPEDIQSVLQFINNWVQDVLAFEINFLQGHPLKRWYEVNKPNLRIGFGSGMTATTISILLSEDLRKKIRNYAGLNRGEDEAPKSRRLFENNNNSIPLGWALIERI